MKAIAVLAAFLCVIFAIVRLLAAGYSETVREQIARYKLLHVLLVLFPIACFWLVVKERKIAREVIRRELSKNAMDVISNHGGWDKLRQEAHFLSTNYAGNFGFSHKFSEAGSSAAVQLYQATNQLIMGTNNQWLPPLRALHPKEVRPVYSFHSENPDFIRICIQKSYSLGRAEFGFYVRVFPSTNDPPLRNSPRIRSNATQVSERVYEVY